MSSIVGLISIPLQETVAPLTHTGQNKISTQVTGSQDLFLYCYDSSQSSILHTLPTYEISKPTMTYPAVEDPASPVRDTVMDIGNMHTTFLTRSLVSNLKLSAMKRAQSKS